MQEEQGADEAEDGLEVEATQEGGEGERHAGKGWQLWRAGCSGSAWAGSCGLAGEAAGVQGCLCAAAWLLYSSCVLR